MATLIKTLKISGQLDQDDLIVKMLDGITKHFNYVEFVKEYVAQNYMNAISFLDLAKVAHVSRGYLSSLFKKEVGCNFPQYLVNFRIDKVAEILNKEKNCFNVTSWYSAMVALLPLHIHAHYKE